MRRKLLSVLIAICVLMCALPAVRAEEAPVKISVASYMYGPADAEKDTITPAVEKMLAEKHGLNVDIEIVYIEYANYSEILNTRLAGGTAPDVFLAMSETKLQEYYDQQTIASWDADFFKQYAPNVWAFVSGGCVNGALADQFDMWLEKSSIDGKMVTVPSFKPDGSMPYKTLVYRGDWLNNLGIAEDELPLTVDEYVDLMYRFTNDDPDGDGENDTYGMSATGIKALFGAQGVYSGFVGGASYWYEENGEVKHPDVSDKAREVIEILAGMYADGVIDPEFVTGTESVSGSYWAISNGLVNGRFGASALASIDHFRLKGVTGEGDLGGRVAQEYWAVNGEDSAFVYAPWPAGETGDYGYCVGYSVAVSESAVYNAAVSPEKLAVIFQILDAFATDDELYMLAFAGNEGEHYTMSENGQVTRLFGNEELNAMGVWGCRSLYGADRAFSALAYNMAFYNDLSIANRLAWFEKPQYNSYIQDAVSTALPSQAALLTELNTLRDETWIAMIKGEKSLDEWDAYVDAYMQLGGQTLYDEANDWYANK